jgi:hypothetical protein
VCRKTHENTSIGSRREEMKSLWVTAYKEQTLKQKKNTRNRYGSGRQSFKPQVAEETGGETRSQHGRKNTNTPRTLDPQKKGEGGEPKMGTRRSDSSCEEESNRNGPPDLRLRESTRVETPALELRVAREENGAFGGL